MSYSVTRVHDISCGHRVFGHEGACAHLHGHNYRFHLTCESIGGLDRQGRVIDFAVIKTHLCRWLDESWDHRFLIFENDPLCWNLKALDDKVYVLPFNPTAENLAEYLVEVVGPDVFRNLGVVLTCVTIEETRKCSATYSLPGKASNANRVDHNGRPSPLE